tara:strand:+ start:926 stop:1309 length:384 start_codon:yes stop_codon:yes gene_type:complete
MQTQTQRLNQMYKEYNLLPEDMFKEQSQGWTIFKRQGIDKIQAAAKINITYNPIVVEKDFVVMKASAKMNGQDIETFGEADRNSNCRQKYPVAMAEKRAMSRAVLKLTGFYALGHFGEDEGEWKKLN